MRYQSQTLRPAALLKGFLLLWFMVITSFGVVHNAEHGFHKHYHYGNECPIYDFCEHQSLGTGLPTILVFFLQFLAIAATFVFIFTLRATPLVSSSPPRGPPTRS